MKLSCSNLRSKEILFHTNSQILGLITTEDCEGQEHEKKFWEELGKSIEYVSISAY